MNKIRLLLIRHGQAQFGQTDYDSLSEIGQQQANLTGQFLYAHGYQFDRIYYGPRVRHQQTAHTLLKSWSTSQVEKQWFETALDEFADGRQVLEAARQSTLDANQPWPDSRQAQLRLYVKTLHQWAQNRVTIDGCVNVDQFYQTVTQWLDQLWVERRDENVLAVTSAGTIAAIICHVLQLDKAKIADFTTRMFNTGLTQVVIQRHRCSIEFINSPLHLPNELVTQI